MRSATHMEYRWAVRGWRLSGERVLYPQGQIKKEARLTAQRLVEDGDVIRATVVDGYEELPDDRTYERSTR